MTATRVASFNAHVGRGLIFDGLRWLLRRHPLTAIVLIQEGRGVTALRRNLGRRYRTWPREQPIPRGKNGRPDVMRQAMTYVAWSKIRYRFEQGWNHDVRRGGQYPRRCTAALLYDRLLRRPVLVLSMHPDPMGKGWRAPRRVLRAHQRQMGAYLDLIAEQQAEHPDLLVVAGGDTNEPLAADVPTRLRPRSAVHGLRGLGLRPAHLGRLDGVWFSDGQLSGRSIAVPVRGMDHPATLATSTTTAQRNRRRTRKARR